MPVQRQRKDITPDTPGSTQEQTTPSLPNQQTFQQYLRELARAALRVVLEGVMREELDALFGVDWGQRNPKRKGWFRSRCLFELFWVFLFTAGTASALYRLFG